MRTPLLLFALALTAAPSTTHGQSLELGSPFQDGVVLQRADRVPLWGFCAPEIEVTVRTSWAETRRVRAGRDGRFRVDLTTPGASTGHEIAVVAGDASVTVRDVAVGEVWLCSGQSNMEWRLKQLGSEYLRDAENANLPYLRYFQVANEIALAPQARCRGSWESATPERVTEWSAVAFYFGRKLHERLGVPIGLLDADWGGTVAEAWTRAEALHELGDFDAELERLAQLARDPEAVEREGAQRRAAFWERLAAVDEGSRGARFAQPDVDTSAWDDVTVPGPWPADLQAFDGVVWLRRSFEWSAPSPPSEARLELGPIDDMDTVWLNGVRVGGIEVPGRWREPRRYAFAGGLLRQGANTLVVRVLDTGGGGGTPDPATPVRLVAGGGATPETTVDLAGPWRARAGASMRELPAFPQPGASFHANSPTALWNGMIAPLVPFGLRGAIWYQGESNRPRAHQYRRLFPAMIQDWRRAFEQPGFPFYFVQIAPFGYGGDRGEAAELREAQFLTLALEGTGMAVTMDIGDPRDIHPRNKRDVGERLARWAFARTYGFEDVVPSGPLYRRMAVEGDAIRLWFEHVDGGLGPRDAPLTHFRIAGADREFHDARAEIDGETIVVRSERVPRPVAVRFAFGAADEPNLRNAAGLPASSFRTDDWPGVTASK